MQIPEDAQLLRIFIGEADRHGHHPLYEVIVKQAREAHLAGATMLRGPMGFGKSSRIHTETILQLSMDSPVVIEIVDSEEKISAFLPTLESLLTETGALVTLERIKVLHYRAKGQAAEEPAVEPTPEKSPAEPVPEKPTVEQSPKKPSVEPTPEDPSLAEAIEES